MDPTPWKQGLYSEKPVFQESFVQLSTSLNDTASLLKTYPPAACSEK